MSPKIEIEQYVRNTTNNEGFQGLLRDAAEFGYNLAKKELSQLKAALKAYEDMDEDPVDHDEETDFSDYLGRRI